MNQLQHESVEAKWARLGVYLRLEPAAHTPDPERLLLETARAVEGNARLLPLVVTWLVEYGNFVAKHRLARLAKRELEAVYGPVLGLILESAVGRGASADLLVAAAVCRPAEPGRPLSAAFRASADLSELAQETASPLSKKWGVWAPEVELKRDAIRPVSWVLEKNPGYKERIVRKGDLRCSILETLRLDTGGRARSESELARLSGATRTAVRKALAALVLEGEVRIVKEPGNDRDHVIVLTRAA